MGDGRPGRLGDAPREANVNHNRTVTLESHDRFGRRIPPQALGAVLETLPDALRGSVRMAVEGRSRARGKRPDWLRAAADLRFVGHEGTDRTLLHFEVPTLGEAAPGLYRQQEFWSTKPAPEDTGFEILADVLADVAARNDDSERFDLPLLNRLGRFRRALNGTFSGMAIPSRRGGSVVINPALVDAAESLHTNTPLPQRVRVVGRLDMLRASTQSFGLLLDDGQEIRGVLTEGDVAAVTPLLGQRVLVLGEAVFRASGRPLRIDAEDVLPAEDVGGFFSKLPEPKRRRLEIREPARGQQGKRGLVAVVGKWPGDETDEQVLAALKELS